MVNNHELDKKADELRDRYGFEGFDQLDDVGTHPYLQWENAVGAALRIQSLAGPYRIQVHPLGHGGGASWDAFEEYILKPRDGNKPRVELNYVRSPEEWLEVGRKRESPTGEFRKVRTSAKNVRIKNAPVVLLADDWTVSGESIIGGPIWVAENKSKLDAEYQYTFVFRDMINLASVSVSRRKEFKVDYGQSNVKYLLIARDKKGRQSMRKTFKYLKDNGHLSMIDPWGWKRLEALELEYPEEV